MSGYVARMTKASRQLRAKPMAKLMAISASVCVTSERRSPTSPRTTVASVASLQESRGGGRSAGGSREPNSRRLPAPASK
jgi:hypothetical protein